MNIYMIIFQMEGAARNSEMIDIVKKYSVWARITNSSYCIKVSDKLTGEIRDEIISKIVLGNTERLMVVDITKSAWASYYLPKEVADWLKRE